MSDETTRALSAPDRFWRGMARHLDRRVLRLIASQPVVRALFAISAPLGSALPRGALKLQRRDGSLEIRPAGVAEDAPLIYYLHGGGFTIGSPRTHAALAGHLAQAAGMRVWLQRYRLAPEHPFPAAKEDAIAGFDNLVATGAAPVALCGDSAGGCLALQVACHARDTGAPLPKALGLIAPIANLAGEIADRFRAAEDEMLIPPEWPERIERCYLPDMARDTPDVSPIHGDLSDLPPTLIQASAQEALAADADKLLALMDDVTVDLWQGLPHVWHLHAGRAPLANQALAEMGAFLAARAEP
jgi:monoterpene epsilon-lactone hydrolase